MRKYENVTGVVYRGWHLVINNWHATYIRTLKLCMNFGPLMLSKSLVAKPMDIKD